MKRGLWAMGAVVLVLAAPACGGSDAEVPAEVDGADGAGLDVGEGDDAGDTTEDVSACENPCKNNFGKNDKKLCPDPKSDWKCVDFCCLPVFKCIDDADCLAQGFAEGHCTDNRYDCRCDGDTGICHVWYCAVDSDCGDGEACLAGTCAQAPEPNDLGLRIVAGPHVLIPGAAGVLLAEAYDGDDGDVAIEVEVMWSSDNPDAVAVGDEDGIVTGGAAGGTATITGTAYFGATATWQVRNVTVDGDATLSVIAVGERSSDPISGRYALADAASGELVLAAEIPADGIIETDYEHLGMGIDVHVMGEAADWVSWLGASGGVLLLPVAPTAWGDISLEQDGSIVEESTTLKGVNVLRGTVDYEDYDTLGEFEISLNSFPFASGLFDFSLATLLGPDVERYFHPDHSLPGVSSQETAKIPGGLTFALGTPALPEFHLAGPQGSHRVWTIGGRVALEDVAELADQIFDAVSGGDFDFNIIVGTLFPKFSQFWSAVTISPALAGDGSSDITDMTTQLRVPMGLTTSVAVPPLPAMGDLGYADALFLLGGAITADALFVPLGINAGSDTTDAEANPPDGRVDGDHKTPELDPLVLPYAPLHSGLQGPHGSYGIACVAASIGSGGDDPRPDGGSAILIRQAPGQSLGDGVDLGTFLGFPMASAYDPESRTLSIDGVAQSDTQRVLFKGKQGEHWTVWLNGVNTYVVPSSAELTALPEEDAPADRTQNVELILVNSFDLRADTTLGDLVTPGGVTLDQLLLAVDRASFLDIRP